MNTPFNPIAGTNPTLTQDPPPQELTWDSTIKDLLQTSYTFSDDLIDSANPPEFLRMYGDRWSVRWNNSGIASPENQSAIDIFFNVRPSGKATIDIKV
jgi:hypothetical protein